ncbi:MAG: hypothetical protein CMF61_00080 [Magnetococcales bacterium]|nr:hypothetical protein [Magnetococcales bacterium]PPR19022.1 MAG: hypothetical protein CFH43_00364 [Pseudomonadota bacterium]|tara:strand:- start:91 stop:312 length:222 start_codon:yes stop_codon:yes gene_type:complete
MTIESALEAIYTSLENDNKGIDESIENLKAEMKAAEMAEVEIENEKLPVPNRVGRNMLKSYFKKRGVKVSFKL